MSTRSISLSDPVHAYVLGLVREAPLFTRLREETSRLSGAGMQISPEQGRFMSWLVATMGARRCLEIGVFTGYSSLSVALALPEDGRLVACDVDAETTAIAARYWREAGVDTKIELRLGPALATLDALVAGGGRGSFDFAFIDADKENYAAYFEQTLALVRPGGVIAVDNALWGGSVADASRTDASTVAIRELNARAAADGRVDVSLVPIGDGLLLARKKA